MENKQLRIYIIVKYSLELISHTIAPHNSLQEVFDIPGNSYCNPPCTSLPYSYRTILSMFMLSSIAVKILYFPGASPYPSGWEIAHWEIMNLWNMYDKGNSLHGLRFQRRRLAFGVEEDLHTIMRIGIQIIMGCLLYCTMKRSKGWQIIWFPRHSHFTRLPYRNRYP